MTTRRERGQRMQLKDYVTIVISGLAFLLSLSATIFSLRKKEYEEQRTLRLSLNDVIVKILGARIDYAKFVYDHRDSPEIFDRVRLNRTYNEQMFSLASISAYLVKRIPSLVSNVDYGIIGDAFALAGDHEGAKQHFEMIFNNSMDRNHETLYHRTFAGYLYQWGDPENGEKEYDEALKSAVGSDDSSKYQQGYTYRTWGISERNAGNEDKAIILFNHAERIYNSISDSQTSLRRVALNDLTSIRNIPARASGGRSSST